jgi:hypothetical protein
VGASIQRPRLPIIIKAQGDHRNPAIHLYVIWDRWQGLRQQERSEIIMDAYETSGIRDDILNVTVAMGLTHDEATQMGLQYTTESAA